MPNVAEVLVQTLINATVRRVYGVVGDSLNGITGTSEKSNWV
jgi:pyruvate dehydrogenase (quinone)